MADRFEVGEIVIYVRPGSDYYGTECEILSPLQHYEVLIDVRTGKFNYDGGDMYEISIPSPRNPKRNLIAPPEWLRKKPRKSPGRDLFNKILNDLKNNQKVEA